MRVSSTVLVLLLSFALSCNDQSTVEVDGEDSPTTVIDGEDEEIGYDSLSDQAELDQASPRELCLEREEFKGRGAHGFSAVDEGWQLRPPILEEGCALYAPTLTMELPSEPWEGAEFLEGVLEYDVTVCNQCLASQRLEWAEAYVSEYPEERLPSLGPTSVDLGLVLVSKEGNPFPVGCYAGGASCHGGLSWNWRKREVSIAPGEVLALSTFWILESIDDRWTCDHEMPYYSEGQRIQYDKEMRMQLQLPRFELPTGLHSQRQRLVACQMAGLPNPDYCPHPQPEIPLSEDELLYQEVSFEFPDEIYEELMRLREAYDICPY